MSRDEVCVRVKQVQCMRLEKKIKDDSVGEPSLSWISWLLWIPYIYAPALDTHTPLEPDLLQSLLHYHNITHTRPTPSLPPTNIMTFAYRCLTCADNTCDMCVCVCVFVCECESVYRLRLQSADIWVQVRALRQSSMCNLVKKILITIIITIIITSTTTFLAWKSNTHTHTLWALWKVRGRGRKKGWSDGWTEKKRLLLVCWNNCAWQTEVKRGLSWTRKGPVPNLWPCPHPPSITSSSSCSVFFSCLMKQATYTLGHLLSWFSGA